jgi:DNA mismatch repair protein MSH3
LGGSNAALTKATMLLNSLPDLGKGLSRIQYKQVCDCTVRESKAHCIMQCTPKEFVRLLTSFKAVSVALDGIDFQDEYRPLSPVLMRILETFPTIKDAVAEWTSCLHLNKARENLKLELWRDEDKFPELTARSTVSKDATAHPINANLSTGNLVCRI